MDNELGLLEKRFAGNPSLETLCALTGALDRAGKTEESLKRKKFLTNYTIQGFIHGCMGSLKTILHEEAQRIVPFPQATFIRHMQDLFRLVFVAQQFN